VKKLSIFLFIFCKCIVYSQEYVIELPIQQKSALGYHDGYNTENINFNNVVQMASYCRVGTSSSGGVNKNRALIQFDLSPYFNLPYFNEVEFIYAEIDLYNLQVAGAILNGHFGTANESKLFLVSQPWNETTVTWNNQPNIINNNSITLSQSVSNFQDYTALDATDVVNFWISNPTLNYGLKLQLDNEVIENGLLFHSSSSPVQDKHPVLRIYYIKSSDNGPIDDPVVPNVFTPNGDGINDFFEISNIQQYNDVKFVVYNRWGQIVYESNNYNNTWDGAGNADGIYFYILEIPTLNIFKGFLTIIRD
jgi:gliding motility-associated-like protein